MSGTSADHHAAEVKPGPSPGARLNLLILVLAVLGFLLSSYLTYVSASGDASPPGCGAGSGCSEVLTSQWSRWFGVPVSALAALLYLVLTVCAFILCARNERTQQAAWLILFGGAVAITGSAAWFIYLQRFKIGAWCPWCMADHIGGLLLSAVIFVRFAVTWHRSIQVRMKLAAALAGIAGPLVVAIVQINTTPALRTHDSGLPVHHEYDGGRGPARELVVLGGRLTVSAHREPLVGSPDAKHLLVAMVDYCCPHCRHTHQVLMSLMDETDLAVLVLPVPLNRKCNRHVPESMPIRFEHSCQLAKTALAVALSDRQKFVEFDRWMFEPPKPRSPADAADKAAQLLGTKRFEQAVSDPRINATLERNIDAYGASGADRLPVIMAPSRGFVEGRVEDGQQIVEWLEQDQIKD